jgi:hypothetical protein
MLPCMKGFSRGLLFVYEAAHLGCIALDDYQTKVGIGLALLSI